MCIRIICFPGLRVDLEVIKTIGVYMEQKIVFNLSKYLSNFKSHVTRIWVFIVSKNNTILEVFIFYDILKLYKHGKNKYFSSAVLPIIRWAAVEGTQLQRVRNGTYGFVQYFRIDRKQERTIAFFRNGRYGGEKFLWVCKNVPWKI